MAKIQKTMIYLGEAEHTRLKYLALDERVSMAELIRRAIADYLKRYPGKPLTTAQRKAVKR
jgi:hypothetical protein